MSTKNRPVPVACRCGDSPDFWRVPWSYADELTEEPLWRLICHNCLRKAEPSGTKEGAIKRWNRLISQS